MALSEHEQRMFDELERELRGEIKANVGGGGHVLLGAVILLAGLIALVFAVIAQITLLGAGGFVLMLVGLSVAIGSGSNSKSANAQKSAGPAGGNGTKPKSAKAPRTGSFFEDRWDRRQGQ